MMGGGMMGGGMGGGLGAIGAGGADGARQKHARGAFSNMHNDPQQVCVCVSVSVCVCVCVCVRVVGRGERMLSPFVCTV